MENQNPIENYSLKASMNFKKGKFVVWANIFCGVIFIVGLIPVYFLFDYNTSDLPKFYIKLLLKALCLLLIILAVIFGSMLIQLAFYKRGGGGKAKFHFGLMVEVFTENAVKRNCYFIAQFISYFVPFALITLFTAIFWQDFLYISALISGSNFLGYIPVYIFAIKQDKNNLFKFENGVLNIYAIQTKPDEAQND